MSVRTLHIDIGVKNRPHHNWCGPVLPRLGLSNVFCTLGGFKGMAALHACKYTVDSPQEPKGECLIWSGWTGWL